MRHTLSDIDEESKTAICAICGLTDVYTSAGKRPRCATVARQLNDNYGGSYEVTYKVRALMRHAGRLPTFDEYWDIFGSDDSPASPHDNDEATWQLAEALVTRHGWGAGSMHTTSIARRRDEEMGEVG